MSATEKLRALGGDISSGEPFEVLRTELATDALVAALPQIVAVVEAAETLVGNQRHPRVSVSDVSPGSSERARAALAALDEALS